MKKKKKELSKKQKFHSHRGFMMKGQFAGMHSMLRQLRNKEYLTSDEVAALEVVYFYLGKILTNFDQNTKQLKANKFGINLNFGESDG